MVVGCSDALCVMTVVGEMLVMRLYGYGFPCSTMADVMRHDVLSHMTHQGLRCLPFAFEVVVSATKFRSVWMVLKRTKSSGFAGLGCVRFDVPVM